MSLPAKIFGLLADCLMEQFEQRRDEGDEWGAESDEDGDDDDDEFGEEVSVSKGGMSSDDFFSLLALGKDLDADDGVDQDLDADADPINQVGVCVCARRESSVLDWRRMSVGECGRLKGATEVV